MKEKDWRWAKRNDWEALNVGPWCTLQETDRVDVVRPWACPPTTVLPSTFPLNARRY